MPTQGPSSRSSNSGQPTGLPHAQVDLHFAYSRCSLPPPLSRASVKRREPLLPFTSTGSLSTNSVGSSRKTYKSWIYNTRCTQAPIANGGPMNWTKLGASGQNSQSQDQELVEIWCINFFHFLWKNQNINKKMIKQYFLLIIHL